MSQRTEVVDLAPPELSQVDGPAINRRHIPFELDAGIGARASIGLIVLATDQTVEYEFRRIFGAVEGVALYESRILNKAQITPETLKEMETGIAPAAGMILPGCELPVVATSAMSPS